MDGSVPGFPAWLRTLNGDLQNGHAIVLCATLLEPHMNGAHIVYSK